MLTLSKDLIEKINESFLGGDWTDEAVLEAVKFAGVYGGLQVIIGNCESLHQIYQNSPNENSGFVGLAAIDELVADIRSPVEEQLVNWVEEVYGEDILLNTVLDLADFIGENSHARCVILAGYQGIDLTRTVSYHTANIGSPEGLLSQVLTDENSVIHLLWAIGNRAVQKGLARGQVENTPIAGLLQTLVFSPEPANPFAGWESIPTTPLEDEGNDSPETHESLYERFVAELPIIPAVEKILALTLKEKELELSNFDMGVMAECYAKRFLDVSDEYVFEAEKLIHSCGLFAPTEQYVLEIAFAMFLKRNVTIINPLDAL